MPLRIRSLECLGERGVRRGYYYNFRNDVIADDPSHIMCLP